MRALRMVLVIVALSIGLFAAESPFSGTWKLNVAKSKMTPPSPQAETVRVDADDNSIKVSDDITDAKGQPMKVSYEAKFDGKDYPATGSPAWDSVSFRRGYANTLKAGDAVRNRVARYRKENTSLEAKTTTGRC